MGRQREDLLGHASELAAGRVEGSPDRDIQNRTEYRVYWSVAMGAALGDDAGRGVAIDGNLHASDREPDVLHPKFVGPLYRHVRFPWCSSAKLLAA